MKWIIYLSVLVCSFWGSSMDNVSRISGFFRLWIMKIICYDVIMYIFLHLFLNSSDGSWLQRAYLTTAVSEELDPGDLGFWLRGWNNPFNWLEEQGKEIPALTTIEWHCDKCDASSTKGDIAFAIHKLKMNCKRQYCKKWHCCRCMGVVLGLKFLHWIGRPKKFIATNAISHRPIIATLH